MFLNFKTIFSSQQSTIKSEPLGNGSKISTKPGSFTVIRATSKHAKELFDLVNTAYKRETTRKETVNRYTNQEEIAKSINDVANVHWLALESSNRIIGSLQILKEGDKYSLNAFAIDPGYKGNNLGPIMLKEAEKFLTTKKVSKVVLSVISIAKKPFNPTTKWEDSKVQIETEDDKLANFYLSNGYKFTGLNTIPSSNWIDLTRKPEYQNKVFFREMEKILATSK